MLAARPDDAVALNNLAWIASTTTTQALPLARRAYLLQPSAQSADTLGWILLQQGDRHVGLLLTRRAAASMPGDPSVLYHFAYGLSQAGERDGAVKLLDAVLRGPASFEERDDATRLLAELGGSPGQGRRRRFGERREATRRRDPRDRRDRISSRCSPVPPSPARRPRLGRPTRGTATR